ncbi:MAG: alkaline phosphatase family protein [Candidatus Eiseniibacteriota bacterium]|jgi:predicted AlkP superfamily phosphohydrolase/phosphomutase
MESVTDSPHAAGRRPAPPRPPVALAAALCLALVPALATPAAAYIGPGAGIAFLGSFMVLFATLFVAGLSLLTWPVRMVLRWLRSRKALARSRVDRVVILGLDGLDPRLAKRFMAEGKLPNFKRLTSEGSFQPLASTYPCMSPVAWSSFMTGTNPAKHNIFDFLSRDPRTYAPAISSSHIEEPARTLKVGRWVIPISRPSIRALRKSVPFWKLLGDHGVPCQVIRVPITFPPEKFNGQILSAMCIPDLRGTQGSFTFWSTDASECGRNSEIGEAAGGERHLVERRGDRIRGTIPGPPNALSRDRELLELPFEVRLDDAAHRATLAIDGGTGIELLEHEYSDWVPLSFAAGLGIKVHGVARFYIMRMGEHFSLYMTPIHLDPEHPAMPISHPSFFSMYLAKIFGKFATLGLAEDTWALNERVIDEKAFLEQALLFHREREQQFMNALDKVKKGLCCCVFDATDRIQHMFFRYIDEKHPAHDEAGAAEWRTVIEDMYQRCDRMVGKVMEQLDDRSVLMVISDHGFTTFRYGVNLNSWLRQHGFLVLKEGATGEGEWYADVDWSRTRAYAFGLGGIFLNQKGREGQGIVARGEEAAAVKAAIQEKLSALRHPEHGERAVLDVVDGDAVYDGPYAAAGPDLIVGFNRGFRVSWACAIGKMAEPVISDNTKSWSGDHCIDPRQVPGVFFCNRDIAAHYPSITDLAPTVLDLFGVDVPPHMDGTVLRVGDSGERLEPPPTPERELPDLDTGPTPPVDPEIQRQAG